jgi:predicted phage tail component-like protein
MTDVTFNGVALSTAVPTALVLGVTRGLLGARRDTWQEVPGRAGAWVYPEKPGDRSIAIPVNIAAAGYAARRAAVNALAAWADSPGLAPLIIDDEPDRYWDAKLTGPADPAEWLLTADAELAFRVGPYSWALDPSTDTWSAADGAPHTVTLPDEVEAQPVLELTAGGAAIPSFTLTVNGNVFQYGTNLGAGAQLTINGIAYMVTTGANIDTALVGAFDPADVSMATVDGVFPLLAPGANTVTLDTPAGQGASITATWRRRYRG